MLPSSPFYVYGSKTLIHSHCWATIPTIHLQNFLISPNGTLSPLNTAFLSPCTDPGTNDSVFCLCESDFSGDLLQRGAVVQHLSFHGWLLSLHIMSLRPIQVVAGVRMPFLFKAESDCPVWMDHTLLTRLFINESACYLVNLNHFHSSPLSLQRVGLLQCCIIVSSGKRCVPVVLPFSRPGYVHLGWVFAVGALKCDVLQAGMRVDCSGKTDAFPMQFHSVRLLAA